MKSAKHCLILTPVIKTVTTVMTRYTPDSGSGMQDE